MAAVIASRAKRILPRTWAYLTDREDFGSDELDSIVEQVKAQVFGAAAFPVDSESDYKPVVQDYLAKLVALEVIPSAIDYYGGAIKSKTTTTTQEQVTYGDQMEALKDLQEWLGVEVRRLRVLVEDETAVSNSRPGGAAVSTAGLPYVSLDPQCTPPITGRPYSLRMFP
jgi:hypothetical protein